SHLLASRERQRPEEVSGRGPVVSRMPKRMRTPKLMFANNLSRRFPHAPPLFYDYPFACPLQRPCRPPTSAAVETLRTKGHRLPIARPALARRHRPFLPLRHRPTLSLRLLPRNRTPSRQRQPPRPATPATGTARRPSCL